jgi:5'-nucleotidase
MLILLTNDDGIRAPASSRCSAKLTALGEVHVVAPETVQSASGHGITLTRRCSRARSRLRTLSPARGGLPRPADCVKLAVAKLLPRQPDLVVSGINSGANVGINVIYSGTIAAAIEAAFLGCRASRCRCTCATTCRRITRAPRSTRRKSIEQLLKAGLSGGQCVSVNLPRSLPATIPPGRASSVSAPRVGRHLRAAEPTRAAASTTGTAACSLLGETEDDTDVAALRDGYITVTPLQFDLTHYLKLRELRDRAW